MVVYSVEYDMMGILVNNLVQISEDNLFIPFTHRWVVL